MENVDMINEPPHYKCHQHECIDEMVAVFGREAVIDFCKCNAWKYRYRAGHKGNEEDAVNDNAKSDWYVSKAMEIQKEIDSMKTQSMVWSNGDGTFVSCTIGEAP